MEKSGQRIKMGSKGQHQSASRVNAGGQTDTDRQPLTAAVTAALDMRKSSGVWV